MKKLFLIVVAFVVLIPSVHADEDMKKYEEVTTWLKGLHETRFKDVTAESVQTLTELDLSGLTFKDTDLKCLLNVGALKNLNLTGSSITDAGLRSISRLTSLTHLNLSKTKITDKGMYHVRLLSANLESLNLSDTSVKDEGVSYILGFTNLKELDVSTTSVTNNMVIKLKASLNQCEVRK